MFQSQLKDTCLLGPMQIKDFMKLELTKFFLKKSKLATNLLAIIQNLKVACNVHFKT